MRKTETYYSTEPVSNEDLDQALSTYAEITLELNPWGSDPSDILKNLGT